MAKAKNNDDLKLSSIPNEKYKKFFEKFKEIETLDIKQWNSKIHCLAYFCKKYKETYGIDYQFKFNDPSPSKCYEVWRISTLISRLSKDPEILKAYIDWVWQEKVLKAKKRFSSISYITNDNEVNQYKMNFLFSNQNTILNRSSLLPDNYKNILTSHDLPMNSYGDLAFFWQSNKSDSLDFDSAVKFASALVSLRQSGFDESVLERIK